MPRTIPLTVIASLFMLGSFSANFIKDTNAKEPTEKNNDKLYKWYGTAPKGSNMRPILATSYVPFKKSYAQLSERQKKIYRADFAGLKPDQKPPFPVGGLQEIYSPLIKGHARIGGGGELLLFAEIDEEGVAKQVTVYTSPTEELAEVATTVLFNIKFEPATCADKPCAMEFPFLFDVPHRNREIQSLNKEDFGKGDSMKVN